MVTIHPGHSLPSTCQRHKDLIHSQCNVWSFIYLNDSLGTGCNSYNLGLNCIYFFKKLEQNLTKE